MHHDSEEGDSQLVDYARSKSCYSFYPKNESDSIEGFSILTALNVPKAVKIGIIVALVAIPFIPAALSVCDSFKNSKQGGNDGIN
jgi:hypothetical protein